MYCKYRYYMIHIHTFIVAFFNVNFLSLSYLFFGIPVVCRLPPPLPGPTHRYRRTRNDCRDRSLRVPRCSKLRPPDERDRSYMCTMDLMVRERERGREREGGKEREREREGEEGETETEGEREKERQRGRQRIIRMSGQYLHFVYFQTCADS